MKSKQLCLAADERNELERFAKTGCATSGWPTAQRAYVRSTRLEAVSDGSRWPPTAVETGN